MTDGDEIMQYRR
ncbi:Protein of unknown function [Escherichia coli D6-117.29]|nr:Protein of unknown function [Escherichia coli D6-117.29]